MNASLAQLLVHLDASPQALPRLQAARLIGQAQGAAVTALYAVTPRFIELPFAPSVGPGVAAALRDIDDELRNRARSAFEQSMATPGVPVTWAEVPDDPVMAAFAQQALYADLLVLGQHDPSAVPSSGLPPDFDIHKAKGLGMRIIGSLARQMKGELGVRAHHPGTEFIVTFPM